jgi:microcystin degradation protein MlrC
MDIMERARRWEVRERDVFVSVFYGFPWSDVPDVGVTVHVMSNGDQVLADHIADDMSEFVWRVREDFVGGEFPQPDEAVAQARAARTAGTSPIVLADYSDRSGDSTFILHEVIEQDLGGVLLATLRDEHVLEALTSQGAKAGDPFSMDVGGFMGPASGSPQRINGKVSFIGEGLGFEQLAIIEFGDNNALIVTPTLRQVRLPEPLTFGPLDPDDYDVIVVKSRVHFRRGFDETGYAKTIVIVDAPGPFIGTVHLDALPYENIELSDYYPWSAPHGD